jgi:hypothetical protein
MAIGRAVERTSARGFLARKRQRAEARAIPAPQTCDMLIVVDRKTI